MAAEVEAAVRNLIADGELAPGVTLVQEQLAERLGVSRTPLREALNRLSDDGLVERRQVGGYRVREVSAGEVAEVQEVRATLELLAVHGSVGRHGRVELAVLEDLIDEMAAADPGDAEAQFDLNRRFHLAVVAPCPNAYLLATLDRLWDHPVHRRITVAYVQHEPGNVARMVAEHRAIVTALRTGDADEVVALSTQHMTDGYGPLAG